MLNLVAEASSGLLARVKGLKVEGGVREVEASVVDLADLV